MESISYQKKKTYSLLPTFLSKIQKLLYNKIPIYRDYYLKILMLVFLSITIGSCYSIETDCDNSSIGGGGDFYWELTSEISNPNSIAVASNGDIWIVARDFETILHKVYLSANNGDTWVLKGSSIPLVNNLQSIAINPVNNYIFYVNGWRMFRSTNRGEDWLQIWEGLPIKDIIITTSGEIYFTTNENVYYSSNNGNIWIKKDKVLPLSSFFTQSLALGTDGTLYAGTSGGIYRSTDGGNTWLPSSNYTNIYPNVSIGGLAITGNGSIYATTDRFEYEIGVLKSTDKGVTWNPVNNGRPVMNAGKIIYNPITKDIFVGDFRYTSNVYRWSNNLGAWRLKNTGISDRTYICDFALNPNTGQMYVATNGLDYTKGGLYRTKNYP